MSNLISNQAQANNLKVVEVAVNAMNPIIFASKYLNTLSGASIVKVDNKVFKIDTVSNDAVEVTAQAIADAAITGLLSDTRKNDSEIDTALAFGLVKSIKMVRPDTATSGTSGSMVDFAKTLKLKILDVTVDTQNEIIFQAKGVSTLDGLTELEGKYYQLDTIANTATIINPAAISKDVKADLLKGKDSSLVRFAERFNLISEITFGVKAVELTDQEKFALENA